MITMEISLMYLYYSGLNNVCHFWYSKEWKEYDKYGENEKIHEILIVITRCTIIVITSFFATMLHGSTKVLLINVAIKEGSQKIDSFGATLPMIVTLFCIIDNITYSLSIYFVYNFGYNGYKKICNICHNSLYSYFQKRHQKQVENGGFDVYTDRYQSKKDSKYNCCELLCIGEIETNSIDLHSPSTASNASNINDDDKKMNDNKQHDIVINDGTNRISDNESGKLCELTYLSQQNVLK